MRFRPIIQIGCMALMAVLSGCSGQRDVREFKLAHSLSVEHPVHKGMVRFAEEVNLLSEGRMRVRIFPSEQLGSEREAIELVQLGIIEITKTGSSVLESFSPDYKVFGLPYLFDSEGHFHKVADGSVGRKILDSSARFQLTGLTFYDAGSRSFYTTKKRVETPADLANLKIRVQQSPMAVNMVSAFGASPTPISWGELYTALQQGVVDGAENNIPSYFISRHYEVAPFLCLDEHVITPDVLVINTRIWESLSDEERGILQAAADASRLYQRQLWADSTEESLDAVKAAGVEVVYPDKESFREALGDYYAPFREDPLMNSLINQIRDVK